MNKTLFLVEELKRMMVTHEGSTAIKVRMLLLKNKQKEARERKGFKHLLKQRTN